MPRFNPQPFNPQINKNVPKAPLAPKFEPRLGADILVQNLPLQLINPYIVPDVEDNYDINNQYNDRNPNLFKSQLGTPVVSSITFNSKIGNNGTVIIPDSPLTEEEKKAGKKEKDPDLTLEHCLITVRQAKKIIQTYILGKNGSVKEYIGLDDYEVRIEGTIFGLNGQYPFDEVNKLMTYCRSVSSPILISCDYLNELFDVNYLVIKDYEIGQEPGGISQQKFTITAISDDFYSDTAFVLNQNGDYSNSGSGLTNPYWAG